MGEGSGQEIIPVITGPTASGKTAVATALAVLLPIEIVSADSRQVYAGLDVGTAKPSPKERAAAPYHGLDLVSPTERYSAGRYAREARGWIEGILRRGRLPVVVGGTGFYLRALFEGLFEEPAMDERRRAALGALLDGRDAAELERWAGRLDPGFRGGGRQRAQRVIEVALLTGWRLTALHAAAPASPPAWRPLYFVVRVPRAELRARIARRVDAMLASGLVEETRGLLAAGIPADAPGLTGVGYRECVAFITGRIGADALAAAITAATTRYAKRQETWFRHQLAGNAIELDGGRPAQALAQDVLAGYRAACA